MTDICSYVYMCLRVDEPLILSKKRKSVGGKMEGGRAGEMDRRTLSRFFSQGFSYIRVDE